MVIAAPLTAVQDQAKPSAKWWFLGAKQAVRT